MIELENFTKKYGSKTVVSGINMTCRKGLITGILGPNGAGKTTILKAVTARHFATSGNVRINGTDCQDDFIKVRSLTGFVTENPSFPEEYKVFEYLEQVMTLHESPRKNLEKVRELCSLDDVWENRISTLSKGYRERLNFAQCLIYEPQILVLDEPASGLDPNQILKMRSLVKSLKKDHTILLSTHLMQEVESLCDYIYIISGG
ncbi:MAG: ABC transporter ATP-binding protein, partial [Treponema sp.]|nr:ABC transporter ATP-binding protein [Treponema sp.]